jgi:hypothetical protein
MSFSRSPPLPRRRPLSVNEIAAIATAIVTACPAPKDMPAGIERVHRVNSTWRRRQVEVVKNDA